VLRGINAPSIRPAKSSVLRWLQKRDDDEDKTVERLTVESSKLQDHSQQSCVIRNVTVKIGA